MFRFLVLILTVLAGTAPLPAQTPDERADAVLEFRRFFKKFKQVGERVEAIQTLEGMESPAAAEELFELLDNKQAEVGQAALAVLSTYRQPETFQPLLEQLPEMSNQTRRARLVQALGESGIKDAIPPIIEAAQDRKAGSELRYAAALSVASLGGSDAAIEMYRSFLGDKDPLVRLGAAEAVGSLRLKQLAPELTPLIGDSTWPVQSAAVKALGSVRVAEAVQPLIDCMRGGGRIAEECADALFEITGMDLGMDADAWQKQWDHLSSIEGWRIPTDEELAKRAAARKRSDALYGKLEKTTSFGGIPTASERILFIIDVSGSMADLVVERENFDSGYDNFEKLTIVKTELLNTIDSLEDGTMFNIVAFARDVKPWKRGMVKSNVVNRSSAKSWVEKLRPIGGPEAQKAAMAGLGGSADLEAGKTNTFAALMYAFGVDPEKPAKDISDEAAMKSPLDTVFFLSDGRPSTGKFTDEGVILSEVVRLNERFKIVIHTIAIGDFQKAFVKSLAEQNGGVFVDLGG